MSTVNKSPDIHFYEVILIAGLRYSQNIHFRKLSKRPFHDVFQTPYVRLEVLCAEAHILSPHGQFIIDDQQDATFLFTYFTQSALHVSGDVFAHHQEHLTVFPASDIVHVCCCRPVSWVDYTRSCKYSRAPDNGRKHRPKHVELIGYK